MESQIIWQQGSNNPENPNNLAVIREWWANLNGQEITWQQRIIPQNGEIEELNWEKQRFDEVFVLNNPEIRGITLYWGKPDNSGERNTTPYKLRLDHLHRNLYIFPQSQKELVIRVGLPLVHYQKISLVNPQYIFDKSGKNYFLQIQDDTQNLEVAVTLSPENLKQLIRALTS